MMTALHAVLGARDHVVAQVVEAELGVGAVSHIGLIGGLLRSRVHAVLNEADLHAEESVDAPHPLGVAAGEVIVHRDDVHVVAGDGVEVARERRDERLALARFHLGDLPVMQRDAADELNVEVTQSDGAHARLANGGERLGQKVVERLPVAVTRAKTLGERGELLVRAVLHLRLERVDAIDDALVCFKLLPLSEAQQL